MRRVYLAHSYRDVDARIVRYFSELIQSEGFKIILDPKPEDQEALRVNAARLQRHLRDTDGMVVILTRRESGVSPHIIFEATLCLQARKPLLVFVEDVLSTEVIPQRILRSRFSRKWFVRQIRDHRQSLRLFRLYLGDDPPPVYQPATTKRTCLAIGTKALDPRSREVFLETIAAHDHIVIAEALSDSLQDQAILISEYLACADLAIEVVDSPDPGDFYWMGAVRAAFIPRISITTQSEYPYDKRIPEEYQPSFISSSSDPETIQAILKDQLELYEQSWLELDTPEEIAEYVHRLLDKDSPQDRIVYNFSGNKEITVGDHYEVGQGIVGPNVQAHDITFQQIWNQAADGIDLAALANDLARLRQALRTEAQTAEDDAAIGEIALAETAAKQNDGPKVLAHLKKAGHWALGTAEKIGVAVAAGAIKTAMGL